MMERKVLFPNLLAEMARKGETQKSIAKVLGVSEPTISLKFKGKSDWTLGEVETLCDYFNKDYYQLFIKTK